jgi:hypothetical protein
MHAVCAGGGGGLFAGDMWSFVHGDTGPQGHKEQAGRGHSPQQPSALPGTPNLEGQVLMIGTYPWPAVSPHVCTS